MYYASNMLKGTCTFGHQPSNASGSGVELATCDLDPGEEMMNIDHAIPGSIIQQSRSTEDSCSAKSDEMCASMWRQPLLVARIYALVLSISSIFMMNIVVWNPRGAGCTKFKDNVADLINIHRMEILVICEPRISGQKAISVVKSLGFPCFEIVDAVGFSSGLWMLWKDSRLKVEVIGTTDQAISVVVRGVGQNH